MQAALWGIVGLGVLLAFGASWAERRRARRRDQHGPGFMPWPTLVFAGVLIALTGLALALRAGE